MHRITWLFGSGPIYVELFIWNWYCIYSHYKTVASFTPNVITHQCRKTTGTITSAPFLCLCFISHLSLSCVLRPYASGHHSWELEGTVYLIQMANRNENKIIIILSKSYDINCSIYYLKITKLTQYQKKLITNISIERSRSFTQANQKKREHWPCNLLYCVKLTRDEYTALVMSSIHWLPASLWCKKKKQKSGFAWEDFFLIL